MEKVIAFHTFRIIVEFIVENRKQTSSADGAHTMYITPFNWNKL